MTEYMVKTVYRPSADHYGMQTRELFLYFSASSTEEARNLAIDLTYRKIGPQCSHVSIKEVCEKIGGDYILTL